MMNVTLRKVKGGEAVRTNEVQGSCFSKPSVGRGFQMFANPVVEGAIGRMIWTSPVKELVEDENKILMETENSTYELEFN